MSYLVSGLGASPANRARANMRARGMGYFGALGGDDKKAALAAAKLAAAAKLKAAVPALPSLPLGPGPGGAPAAGGGLASLMQNKTVLIGGGVALLALVFVMKNKG